jgi:sterol desaturase/sphingolipid hydroxylase (fatty acid hydroxylase superfamily)
MCNDRDSSLTYSNLHRTGFLDGDRYSREKVSDAFIDQIFASFPGVVFSRSALTVCLAYRPSAPIRFSPWVVAELALYPIILDLFFYVYHRAVHEVDGLWKYHRSHHLTKHPNILLSSLAGVEQEIVEFAIMPFLAYVTLKMCGFPMGFYEWWLCQSFNLFTEACWHSGIRVMLPLPGPCAPLMKIIGCELVLEDHDLHHRHGWRSAGNYGKVTRLWDRIFGTCMNRIESNWENVDFTEPLIMPWL